MARSKTQRSPDGLVQGFTHGDELPLYSRSQHGIGAVAAKGLGSDKGLNQFACRLNVVEIPLNFNVHRWLGDRGRSLARSRGSWLLLDQLNLLDDPGWQIALA